MLIPSSANPKQHYNGYIIQIEMPLKGGKGKWEQFSRQKAVPRDAVGFARHLIILSVFSHMYTERNNSSL